MMMGRGFRRGIVTLVLLNSDSIKPGGANSVNQSSNEKEEKQKVAMRCK